MKKTLVILLGFAIILMVGLAVGHRIAVSYPDNFPNHGEVNPEVNDLTDWTAGGQRTAKLLIPEASAKYENPWPEKCFQVERSSIGVITFSECND